MLSDCKIGLGPVETGLDTLAALAPYLPNECHMIHGGLLSRNVLAADGTITAVLAWDDALYGGHLGHGWRASSRRRRASSPCGGLGHPRGRRPGRDVSHEDPAFPLPGLVTASPPGTARSDGSLAWAGSRWFSRTTRPGGAAAARSVAG